MTDYFGDIVIPPTYASPADWEAWTGKDAPSNIVQILRDCSTLVTDATEGAFYDTDPTTGLPTDVTILQGMQDATCIQAAAWVTLGVDPNSGGVLTLDSSLQTSKRLGSAAFGYSDFTGSQVAAARQAALISLVPTAMKRLQQLNLLGMNPWYYG